MESGEVREQLAAAERGAAAPYVEYPPTPWWYAPVVGLWAAGMVGAFTWWRESVALFLGSLAVLILLEVLFLTWMRRRHGALPMPGKGTPPPEIAVLWRRYFGSLVVVVLVVAGGWLLGGVPVAAALAFVLVTAGLAVYERRYAKAAAAVRARLA
ncbi:hypothetical protein [Asanoa siamensis]|uniref:hypothetical protein n=1 Tax=Asanoa siamensis TaxID=926357 RepID=UPI0019423F3A|nr:hypothetical protein [Asanoa siamensis]